MFQESIKFCCIRYDYWLLLVIQLIFFTNIITTKKLIYQIIDKIIITINILFYSLGISAAASHDSLSEDVNAVSYGEQLALVEKQRDYLAQILTFRMCLLDNLY